MTRMKLKTRRQTLCVTVTASAFDRVDEIADNVNDGNMSKTIEMLINEYYDNWLRVTGGQKIVECFTDGNGKQ